jgi:hypothetical protein
MQLRSHGYLPSIDATPPRGTNSLEQTPSTLETDMSAMNSGIDPTQETLEISGALYELSSIPIEGRSSPIPSISPGSSSRRTKRTRIRRGRKRDQRCDSCKQNGTNCERVKSTVSCKACLDSDGKVPCSRTFRNAYGNSTCERCRENNMDCLIPMWGIQCHGCKDAGSLCSRIADVTNRGEASRKRAVQTYRAKQKALKAAQTEAAEKIGKV